MDVRMLEFYMSQCKIYNVQPSFAALKEINKVFKKEFKLKR